MSRTLKGVLIGGAALVASTVAIQASDLVRGIDGALVALVEESSGPCGVDAVQFQMGNGILCVDRYEAAAGADCLHRSPANHADTTGNLLQTDCVPVSAPEQMPWRFVSLSEAEQLCARAGKRLPRNEEWHRLALTLVDQTNCVIEGEAPHLTGVSGCQTGNGVHDLVGNVWEWIDGAVTSGQYNGRNLPESGYVTVTDNDGIVLETAPEPDVVHGNDYAWTSGDGIHGLLRGGFFGSGEDAGLYIQNLAAPFDLRTSGVGFRCVRNI